MKHTNTGQTHSSSTIPAQIGGDSVNFWNYFWPFFLKLKSAKRLMKLLICIKMVKHFV
jgi:hypothetical protein